jgi:hypothetical protein
MLESLLSNRVTNERYGFSEAFDFWAYVLLRPPGFAESVPNSFIVSSAFLRNLDMFRLLVSKTRHDRMFSLPETYLCGELAGIPKGEQGCVGCIVPLDSLIRAIDTIELFRNEYS